MSKRVPILLGLLLLALALWVRVTTLDSVRDLRNRFEAMAYDIELRAELLTKRHVPFKTSIAIVDINDNSLKQEGRWPWPRSKLATLVNHIRAQGAVVIAFDMIFPQPEKNIATVVYNQLIQHKLTVPQLEPLFKKVTPYFDSDAQFAASLAQGDSVIGVNFLIEPGIEGVIPPPLLTLRTQEERNLDFYELPGVTGAIPQLASAAKNVGFIDIFPDDDGIIRRVPLLINHNNGLYPSLALEAVRVFLLSKIQIATADYEDGIRLEGVKLGRTIIPTDDKCQVIIPFRGLGYTFPFYSAADVLNSKIPPDAFIGKIVFVGSTAVGLGDIHATAVQGVFPGIEVNATVADALLKNNFPYKPVWALGLEVFLIFVIGIVLAFLFPYLGPKALTLLIFIIPTLLIIAVSWFSQKTNMVISIIIPLVLSVLLAMLNIVYGYLFESRRRKRIKKMFGQYVPAKHIDEMLKSSTHFGLQGEDREMTVLFADIRNFTTISEGMSASQLKDMLSEFFTPMTEIIFKYRGTIDKYVGDLVMAFWGAPLKDKKHAEHALSAAIEMQKEIIRLKPALAERKWPDIQIGIGINTGMMSVGDMGSKFRLNYTVLGDAVNLASRVESLTKYYGVNILTTELTQTNQNKFVFRLLDRVRVKGKNASVALYEVIGKQSELSEALRQELKLSDSALNLYFQQQWAKAHEAFAALQESYPAVKLYSLYVERIAEFIKTPPPADWDGVYMHTNK